MSPCMSLLNTWPRGAPPERPPVPSIANTAAMSPCSSCAARSSSGARGEGPEVRPLWRSTAAGRRRGLARRRAIRGSALEALRDRRGQHRQPTQAAQPNCGGRRPLGLHCHDDRAGRRSGPADGSRRLARRGAPARWRRWGRAEEALRDHGDQPRQTAQAAHQDGGKRRTLGNHGRGDRGCGRREAQGHDRPPAPSHSHVGRHAQRLALRADCAAEAGGVPG
jgi:hypothetical protein